jgi:hypothetical protein
MKLFGVLRDPLLVQKKSYGDPLILIISVPTDLSMFILSFLENLKG